MKVLLAGSTGVIGRLLLPLLLNHGHRVVATSRRTANLGERREGLRWQSVNIFDRDAVFALMKEERPDCVMHQLTDLSSMDSEANARLRTVGTRNLVDAARAADVTRMVAQSIAWLYEPGSEPADEDTPLDVHAQASRKTTIDGVCALESAAGQLEQSVILRYGTLYGPGTWYARDGVFAKRVRQQAIEQSTEITNFLHVEDAAKAALLALQWPNGRVNIVDDAPATASEWLPLYADLLGAPTPSCVPEIRQAPLLTRPVSNRRARSLGWVPQYPTWHGNLGVK